MTLRLSPARWIMVAFIASLLLKLQAVKHDDSKLHPQSLMFAESNSSLKPMAIDDCNALLYTIMNSDDDPSKEALMLVLRGSLFAQNGMDVMTDFISDGLYTIELDQAASITGTHIGQNKLTVVKEPKEGSFAGAFVIKGHTLGWLAEPGGGFFWHSGEASGKSIHIGAQALSASCFMIVGSAFIASAIVPDNPGAFAKDALVIFNSAPVLTGYGDMNTDLEISDLLASKSISGMQSMFAQHCGDVLKLSVGDTISAVGPPPKNPPPPEDDAAFVSMGGQSQGRMLRLSIHGV
eukprot:TRINITY_DN16991_c1_g1_i1.p1 TRINITY_DN16991_c1_g1~~TRINITY_DN16991_c1_g1_i1.p1  ORF type:complete len:293 (+),score=46.20 TRINITY_DN16991_c1_g1_i1:129-1007(+)